MQDLNHDLSSHLDVNIKETHGRKVQTTSSHNHINITSNHPRKQLVLALDLDNTLIHAELVERTSTVLIDTSSIDTQNNKDLYVLDLGSERLLIKLRPFLLEFVRNLKKKYQILLCTRGIRIYVDRILEWIDPDRTIIPKEQVISGEQLTVSKSTALKQIVEDYKRVVILDDNPELWGRNQDKVIFTKPFFYFQAHNGALTVRRNTDIFLPMLESLLGFIHKTYFRWPFKRSCISLCDIYHNTLESLFSKKSFAFYGMFRNNEELQKSRAYHDLKRLGAHSIAIKFSEETDIILSQYNQDLSILEDNDVPLVSMLYINYCEMFCTLLDIKIFDLRVKDSLIMHLEKAINESANQQVGKGVERKNGLLDEMEKAILEKEQGRDSWKEIEDIVMMKLKDKYVNKGARRLKEWNTSPVNETIDGNDDGEEVKKKVKGDVCKQEKKIDFK